MEPINSEDSQTDKPLASPPYTGANNRIGLALEVMPFSGSRSVTTFSPSFHPNQEKLLDFGFGAKAGCSGLGTGATLVPTFSVVSPTSDAEGPAKGEEPPE